MANAGLCPEPRALAFDRDEWIGVGEERSDEPTTSHEERSKDRVKGRGAEPPSPDSSTEERSDEGEESSGEATVVSEANRRMER